MNTSPEEDKPKSLVADKAALIRILEAQDRQMGSTFDPAATPQQARALLLEQDVRPEDNTLSCEFKRMPSKIEQ